MLIDWFTVAAQVLNFLILVWLMKRYLYKPILGMIDGREKKIAAELSGADQKMKAAQSQSDDFKKKSDAFDQQRALLLTQATNEANTQKDHLISDAKAQALAIGKKGEADSRAAELDLQEKIVSRAQSEVFAIARKALSDLSGVTLEERIVALFIARLRGLSDEEKNKMSEALKTPIGPLIVHSAATLSAEQMKSVGAAIHDSLQTSSAVQFETAPDLIAGIELLANGQKVSWSIADYLSLMKKNLADISAPAGA